MHCPTKSQPRSDILLHQRIVFHPITLKCECTLENFLGADLEVVNQVHPEKGQHQLWTIQTSQTWGSSSKVEEEAISSYFLYLFKDKSGNSDALLIPWSTLCVKWTSLLDPHLVCTGSWLMCRGLVVGSGAATGGGLVGLAWLVPWSRSWIKARWTSILKMPSFVDFGSGFVPRALLSNLMQVMMWKFMCSFVLIHLSTVQEKTQVKLFISVPGGETEVWLGLLCNLLGGASQASDTWSHSCFPMSLQCKSPGDFFTRLENLHPFWIGNNPQDRVPATTDHSQHSQFLITTLTTAQQVSDYDQKYNHTHCSESQATHGGNSTGHSGCHRHTRTLSQPQTLLLTTGAKQQAARRGEVTTRRPGKQKRSGRPEYGVFPSSFSRSLRQVGTGVILLPNTWTFILQQARFPLCVLASAFVVPLCSDFPEQPPEKTREEEVPAGINPGEDSDWAWMLQDQRIRIQTSILGLVGGLQRPSHQT